MNRGFKIKALCKQAAALYDAGRLAEAEQLYVKILARDASNVEAHYNRGITLLALGRPGDALACFEQTLEVAPKLAGAHGLRGEALKGLDRPEEALAAYDQSVALDPNLVAAWNNRVDVLRDMNRLDDALASVDQAISIEPNSASAWSNRAAVLLDLKLLVEALASADKAISLQPNHATAWNNRAIVLRALKRLVEALASVDKAISLQPDYADAWNKRGYVLRDMTRLDDGLASVDKAISLQPNNADAWSNRASLLLGLNRPDEALASADKALSLQPNNADAWAIRGHTLSDLGRLDETILSYSNALAIQPDHAFLFGHYLHAKMILCDWDQLADNIDKCATGIRAGKKISVPFNLLALVDDPALHKLAAQIYSDANYPKSLGLPSTGRPGGRNKIRVGYYSADFHCHATSFLMAELLEAHDTAKFELYGFSFGPNLQDAMRRRISSAFDSFLDVAGLRDGDIVKLSRERGIDIAVDLKGYTRNSRPGIFAQAAAPVQVNYLGYPGTLSAEYMDYVIADRTVIPPGSEKDYKEKIVWLPHSYQANDSRRQISPRVVSRQEVGLPACGFVFCCFNRNYKILPETFDSWMRILKAVNGSVLWLLEDDPLAAKNLRKEAAAKGVDAGRLIFAGRLPMDEHLGRQRLADLFLDTWPCNAHTTASDALWAGLPVLTCTGKSFASRVAASLLNAVGLPGLITSSREDYEALAIALASTPPRLARFRKILEENRTTAPLFDGKLSARYLGAAYETIFARYQSGLPPDNIEIPS